MRYAMYNAPRYEQLSRSLERSWLGVFFQILIVFSEYCVAVSHSELQKILLTRGGYPAERPRLFFHGVKIVFPKPGDFPQFVAFLSSF